MHACAQRFLSVVGTRQRRLRHYSQAVVGMQPALTGCLCCCRQPLCLQGRVQQMRGRFSAAWSAGAVSTGSSEHAACPVALMHAGSARYAARAQRDSSRCHANCVHVQPRQTRATRLPAGAPCSALCRLSHCGRPRCGRCARWSCRPRRPRWWPRCMRRGSCRPIPSAASRCSCRRAHAASGICAQCLTDHTQLVCEGVGLAWRLSFRARSRWMTMLQMLHGPGEIGRGYCPCQARCCTSRLGCQCVLQSAGSPDRSSGGQARRHTRTREMWPGGSQPAASQVPEGAPVAARRQPCPQRRTWSWSCSSERPRSRWRRAWPPCSCGCMPCPWCRSACGCRSLCRGCACRWQLCNSIACHSFMDRDSVEDPDTVRPRSGAPLFACCSPGQQPWDPDPFVPRRWIGSGSLPVH